MSRPADRLLTLEEVCAITRRPPATEYHLRHCGKAPYLWRSDGRLVAWESELLRHLERQRDADRVRS